MNHHTSLQVHSARLKRAFEARVPGSKSLTNRALIAAALCSEPVVLQDPLASEDTELALAALRQLGVEVGIGEDAWTVRGGDWSSEGQELEFNLGNAGTAVRFLSAVLCARGIRCRIDGCARMRERPVGILLKGLRDLGGDIRSIHGTDCPPLEIGAGRLAGGSTELSGQVSSQYFSGLMMACPLAAADSTIRVSDEWLSRPYIEMTARMLRDFGISAIVGDKDIRIPGKQTYHSPGTYQIEPDATAATYPLTLAVLHGVPVRISRLGRNSLQGDIRYADVLKSMGCDIQTCEDAIQLGQGRPLRPLDADCNDIPDAAMTLAVLLAVVPGHSRLRGLSNLKFKECDRLKALECELGKMGARVRALDDGFDIEGVALSNLKPAIIDTYKDHRMAMCLSLLGTLVPGTVINDPGCVEKTYPNYWRDLERWMDAAGG